MASGSVDTGNKTLLKSDSLYKYILETTVFPRENDYLRELRLITDQHPLARMISSPDEAQFLGLLLKILNAKNTLEIGVFTGYSLLASALSLPHDGKIIAIDPIREFYEIGRPIIEKAGMDHKIDFRESPALPILDQLVSQEKNIGKFDFAFVDADKKSYPDYHEQLLKLVRVGGIIAYDNTLWGGTVALLPDEPIRDFRVEQPELIQFTKEFNTMLAADKRLEVSQLSIADGLTLCRRIG